MLSTRVRIKCSRSSRVKACAREKAYKGTAVTVDCKTIVNRIMLSNTILSFQFVWLITLGFRIFACILNLILFSWIYFLLSRNCPCFLCEDTNDSFMDKIYTSRHDVWTYVLRYRLLEFVHTFCIFGVSPP